MTTYDPALCERLVAMLRSTEINAEAIDEHELADQLEAARLRIAEHETASDIDWRMLAEIRADREAWREGNKRLTVERDALRAEVERLKSGQCPACEGRRERLHGDMRMRPCTVCLGTGKVTP